MYDTSDCTGIGYVSKIGESCHKETLYDSVNVSFVPSGSACMSIYTKPDCTEFWNSMQLSCGCNPELGIIVDCDRGYYTYCDNKCVQYSPIYPFNTCTDGMVLSKGECRLLEKRQQTCTAAFALVHDIGQNAQIQIIAGQPVVTPKYNVLYARVYNYDPMNPVEGGYSPFQWQSNTTLQLNLNESIVLLSVSDCPFFSLHYAGSFNSLLN